MVWISKPGFPFLVSQTTRMGAAIKIENKYRSTDQQAIRCTFPSVKFLRTEPMQKVEIPMSLIVYLLIVEVIAQLSDLQESQKELFEELVHFL